jgi:hypothetical protein
MTPERSVTPTDLLDRVIRTTREMARLGHPRFTIRPELPVKPQPTNDCRILRLANNERPQPEVIRHDDPMNRLLVPYPTPRSHPKHPSGNPPEAHRPCRLSGRHRKREKEFVGVGRLAV